MAMEKDSSDHVTAAMVADTDTTTTTVGTTMATIAKRYSPKEIANHNTLEDIWVIVNGGVYDLTNFLSEHPGGSKILKAVAGKDASKKFRKYHRPNTLAKYSRLYIGDVGPELDGKKRGTFLGINLGSR